MSKDLTDRIAYEGPLSERKNLEELGAYLLANDRITICPGRRRKASEKDESLLYIVCSENYPYRVLEKRYEGFPEKNPFSPFRVTMMPFSRKDIIQYACLDSHLLNWVTEVSINPGDRILYFKYGRNYDVSIMPKRIL